MDHAENGSIGADSQCNRENYSERKPWRFANAPKASTQVMQYGLKLRARFVPVHLQIDTATCCFVPKLPRITAPINISRSWHSSKLSQEHRMRRWSLLATSLVFIAALTDSSRGQASGKETSSQIRKEFALGHHLAEDLKRRDDSINDPAILGYAQGIENHLAG